MRRQAAEPRADGAARRRGATGRVRDAHAEGGDERGDPRLDRERRGHALPDRLVRRPGAVPGDRARAPVGDRPRGARAAARGRGAAARGRARVRRRRLERDRALRRASWTTPRCGWSASRPAARRASARAAPRCCTARARRCSPTRTARCSTPQSISAGLDYPGVGPEHAFLRDSGRAEYVGASDEEALAAFRRLARTEGHPARARARPCAGPRRRPGGGARAGLPLGPRRQGPGRGHRPVTGQLDWDPERAASFYDDYGETGVDALRGRAHTGAEPRRPPRPAPALRQRRRPGARRRRRARALHDRARPPRRTGQPSPTSRPASSSSTASTSPRRASKSRHRAQPSPTCSTSRVGTTASFDAAVCFGGPLSYVVDRADEGDRRARPRDEAGRPRARLGDVARRHGRPLPAAPGRPRPPRRRRARTRRSFAPASCPTSPTTGTWR